MVGALVHGLVRTAARGVAEPRPAAHNFGGRVRGAARHCSGPAAMRLSSPSAVSSDAFAATAHALRGAAAA